MSRLKELRTYVDKKINEIEDDDKRISAAAHLYGVSLAAQMLFARNWDCNYSLNDRIRV